MWFCHTKILHVHYTIIKYDVNTIVAHNRIKIQELKYQYIKKIVRDIL
jgi:hypothetical protein